MFEVQGIEILMNNINRIYVFGLDLKLYKGHSMF